MIISERVGGKRFSQRLLLSNLEAIYIVYSFPAISRFSQIWRQNWFPGFLLKIAGSAGSRLRRTNSQLNYHKVIERIYVLLPLLLLGGGGVTLTRPTMIFLILLKNYKGFRAEISWLFLNIFFTYFSKNWNISMTAWGSRPTAWNMPKLPPNLNLLLMPRKIVQS